MYENPFVCTSGLRRRTVLPNKHQPEHRPGGQPSERARLVRRHYDWLATAVLREATDRRAPVTAQAYGMTVVAAEDQRSVPAESAVKAVQTSLDCLDGMGGDDDNDDDDDDSCVDLKAVVKLRKLCLLLKTNVNGLRTVYRKRRDTGYEYEERERSGLDTGLRALDEDVLRLLDALDDMAGYRDEVKGAARAYTDHEARYRALRALNKRAKLRNRTAVGDDSHTVCAFLRKYLVGPCCEWMMSSKRTRNADGPSRDARGR